MICSTLWETETKWLAQTARKPVRRHSGGYKEKGPVSSLCWEPFSDIFSWRSVLFPSRNFHFGWPTNKFQWFQKVKSKKKKKKKKKTSATPPCYATGALRPSWLHIFFFRFLSLSLSFFFFLVEPWEQYLIFGGVLLAAADTTLLTFKSATAQTTLQLHILQVLWGYRYLLIQY